MRKANQNYRGYITNYTSQFKINRRESTVLNNKNERSSKMKHQNLKSPVRKMAVLAMILFSLLASFAFINGCGDSNLSGIQNTGSMNSAAGENLPAKSDSTLIRLSMNISFKSKNISESRIMESNNGNGFNNIVSIDNDVKPGEELDLQELQPRGIYGLYLSSTGSFTITNSDGLAFRSKTILMEKCEFIDLKLRNNEQKIIHVTGFVAGE